MNDATTNDAGEAAEADVLIRLRLGPGDARYGGDLVAGATAMAIFGDLETELAIRTFPGTRACASPITPWLSSFSPRFDPGDFIEGRARIVSSGRTSRRIQAELHKVIGAEPDGRGSVLDPPIPRGARGGDDRLSPPGGRGGRVTRDSLVDALCCGVRLARGPDPRPAIQAAAGRSLVIRGPVGSQRTDRHASLLDPPRVAAGRPRGRTPRPERSGTTWPAYFGILRAGVRGRARSTSSSWPRRARRPARAPWGRACASSAGARRGRSPASWPRAPCRRWRSATCSGGRLRRSRRSIRADAMILLTSGSTGRRRASSRRRRRSCHATVLAGAGLPFSADDVSSRSCRSSPRSPSSPAVCLPGAARVLPSFESPRSEEACCGRRRSTRSRRHGAAPRGRRPRATGTAALDDVRVRADAAAAPLPVAGSAAGRDRSTSSTA